MSKISAILISIVTVRVTAARGRFSQRAATSPPKISSISAHFASHRGATFPINPRLSRAFFFFGCCLVRLKDREKRAYPKIINRKIKTFCAKFGTSRRRQFSFIRSEPNLGARVRFRLISCRPSWSVLEARSDQGEGQHGDDSEFQWKIYKFYPDFKKLFMIDFFK